MESEAPVLTRLEPRGGPLGDETVPKAERVVFKRRQHPNDEWEWERV